MSQLLEITIVNTGERLQVEGGTTLAELLPRLASPLGFAPICALVNNRTESLAYPLFMPKMVEFLRPEGRSSRRVLARSLCMLLYKAVSAIYPGARLVIEHSLSHGYICRLTASEGENEADLHPDLEKLLEEMRRLVAMDLPFERHEKPTSEVIPQLRSQGLHSTVCLLETLRQLYTVYYTLDGLADVYHGPLAPSTGALQVFDLKPVRGGFLLLPPDCEHPEHAAVPEDQPKMQAAFDRHLQFNRIVGVSDVGELNKAIDAGHAPMLINLCEALHSKQLAQIADEIAKREARIVLIAGPSSSGKTTTGKRIGVELLTNLLKPKMISLDDYFVDRELTPRDASGDYDYESLYALDLPKLSADLTTLLAGGEVNLPTYSFELGRRVERDRPMRLLPREVLVIEGIHGLNPALVPGVDSAKIFKVYVSALTTLSIDDHNWIPTSDNRLLRRIVRDHKYRKTSAVETIRRWDSVARGENRWIFPYQENADATFNSSLLFELAVMKPYAEPLLRSVPHDLPQYAEAARLLRFLECIRPLREEGIPGTSLLREFLGGSSFNY